MSDLRHSSNTGGQQLVVFTQSDKAMKDTVGVRALPIGNAGDYSLQGPVVAGVVYVAHSLDSRQLIPFAEYEERLARDKLNETLRVFTSLGASRIVAISDQQDARTIGGALKLFDRGLSAVKSRESSWSLAFDQRGKGGRAVDPRPLKYPGELGLDAACEGVLHLGVQRHRSEITRSSQYGLDGELAARLRKAKFNLGVEGKRSLTTRFVVEAAFSQEAATELDTLVAVTSDENSSGVGRLIRRRTNRQI